MFISHSSNQPINESKTDQLYPLNTTPPQSSLVTLPPSITQPSPSTTPLLRILSPLILPPHPELHNPTNRRQCHNRHTHPRNRQVLPSLVRIHADIVAIFIDQIRGFGLEDRDDDGSDQQGQEGEGSEAPVAEGDEAGTVQEERDEGGEDGETGGGDADGVEDEGCVEGGVEGVEAVLDVRGPVDVGEVEVVFADGEFL